VAYTNPTAPNLADFITFCAGQGVPAIALPVDSDWYRWALDWSQSLVRFAPAPIPPIQYVQAVYNLGLHWLIENAPDQTGLTLVSLAWANGQVTVTTETVLGLSVGNDIQVCIAGAAPAAYNGKFMAVATGTTTLVYDMPSDPGANTSPGLLNLSFFSELRKQFNLLAFVPGIVTSASDQGTQASLTVPDQFKGLTMQDLDLIKTPWGRAYLFYAQKAGPTVVGVS
jgi:hypothetical protein